MSALAGAIEREAKVQGVWVPGDDDPQWSLSAYTVDEYIVTKSAPRSPGDILLEEEIAPVDAGIWLLTRKAGHTIDQRCSACERRGRGWEYEDWNSAPPRGPGEGWEYAGLGADLDALCPGMWEQRRREQFGRVGVHWYRLPCPSCAVDGNPTGRVQTPAHEVLLAALPSFDVAEHTMAALVDIEAKQPARDDITVLAERLMLDGDPLGELLALRLAGKLEERHVFEWEYEAHEFGSGRTAADGWLFSVEALRWERLRLRGCS